MKKYINNQIIKNFCINSLVSIYNNGVSIECTLQNTKRFFTQNIVVQYDFMYKNTLIERINIQKTIKNLFIKNTIYEKIWKDLNFDVIPIDEVFNEPLNYNKFKQVNDIDNKIQTLLKQKESILYDKNELKKLKKQRQLIIQNIIKEEKIKKILNDNSSLIVKLSIILSGECIHTSII